MDKKRLNILFITPAYYPAIQWGGPARSVHMLAKELVLLGHKVTVYTTAFGLEKNVSRENILDAVRVNYFSYIPIGRWFFSFVLLKELLKKMRYFDVFHIHLIWDPVCLVAGFMLALKKKRYIVSPRGALEWRLIKRRSFLKKMIVYHLFLRFILKRAYALHFTTDYEKDEFIKFTGLKKRQAVIFNLFEKEEFKKKADPALLKKWDLVSKKYILYFGRINWKKGIEILVRAFYEFRQRHLGFMLVIAGPDENDYKKQIEKEVDDLGIRNEVIFTGLVDGELRIALFQNASLFILPSYSENFGMVVVEALAAEIPVIISDKVGLKDLLERYDAGLVFELDEENITISSLRLLAKMEEMLEEGGQDKFIKNSDQLLVNEFNSRSIGEKMIELYTKGSLEA